MTDHQTHHDHGPDDPVDTTGVHGMWLVGESPVYVSHLPMFMVPHNYQVILKVTLEDDVNRKLADLRAAVRQRHAGHRQPRGVCDPRPEAWR